MAWATLQPPTWALDVGVRGKLGVAVRTPATGELARYGVEVFDQSWRVAGGPLPAADAETRPGGSGASGGGGYLTNR